MHLMWQFISDRWQAIALAGVAHANLVFQAVLLATLIALAIAVLIVRVPALDPIANALSAIGLTLPALALVGLLLPLTGLGAITGFVAVAFYAVLPILRNAVVGLAGVDKTLLESAAGMGMTGPAVLMRVRIPLAWPVILAGIRISTQMSMGVAAIAAYVNTPGLGIYIYDGIVQTGGVNALPSAIVGTVGIVLIALLADLVLVAVGRATTSKGIRVA